MSKKDNGGSRGVSQGSPHVDPRSGGVGERLGGHGIDLLPPFSRDEPPVLLKLFYPVQPADLYRTPGVISGRSGWSVGA